MPLSRAPAHGGATLDDVRLDEVDAFATSLPGVRRKGHPGRWETHHKLQADLAGDADAIRDAIRRAWAMQRRRHR